SLPDSASAKPEKSEVHVKIGLLLASEMDSYDQAGMLSGEIIVDGEQRELFLWGHKIRNQGELLLPVDVKGVATQLVFQSEGGSSDVGITCVDLKCQENIGAGFTFTVKKSPQNCRTIPSYLKHKIIEGIQVSDTSRLVSDIREPCSKVPELTGGKGSSLAVLDSIAREVKTFSVPRGFIVTTNAYKRFSSDVEFGNVLRRMENAMARDDWQASLKEVCSGLMNDLVKINIPADVEKEICDHLSMFDESTMFAVRSSALGEDSEDMSAAGQMITLLGVRGQENVINAVVKCWASQFSFTNVNYK
ncbi:hypothetical protein MTO96_044123, partial [Rhipicephalus appendiculatus]